MKQLFICVMLFPLSITGRSIYRPIDPLQKRIVTSWVGDRRHHELISDYLEEYALFKIFDKDFFEKKLLPPGTISYRYEPEKLVSSKTLENLIEELLIQIKQHKINFSAFTILQSKDFDFKQTTGLLVLKFNDYPFVLKLFIETPQTFIDPFNKGMEPCFSFFLGGGINRHILGFTRLKNKEVITFRLSQSPYKDEVDMPRKWHYLPKESQWIQLEGFNFDKQKKLTTAFPGTYCIIADAIEPERIPSLFNEADKKRALDLCNYLNLWIDPHMTNFMVEKYSHKFVLVDTEHFPSFTGLREPIKFRSYSSWYIYLAGKCWKNTFMTTKRNRRNPTRHTSEMNLVDGYNKLIQADLNARN